jgi:uncharacterized protein YndB with AHSA1/START domain
MTDIIHREITLNCPQSHAFKVFTQMIDAWWPRTHRRTQGAKLIMQQTVGGSLLERAPDGAEWQIGAITSFQPPALLEFDWFPGSPNAPTHVQVTFSQQGAQTIIAITHQAITKEAAEIWPEKIALFQKGWDTILPPFKTFCEKPHD